MIPPAFICLCPLLHTCDPDGDQVLVGPDGDKSGEASSPAISDTIRGKPSAEQDQGKTPNDVSAI